ncbi:hypothetical protein Tco_0291036 [Tanacetum coccineum]
MAVELPQTLEYRGGQFNDAPRLEDFQDSPDDEDDTRSSQEYMDDLDMEFHERALLATSKNKIKAKPTLLSLGASTSKSTQVRNQVLMALADDESSVVGKESARNGEWVKISIRKCNIIKPIWYLDSGCSRQMTGVKSYMHKYVEQPGPNMVFGDDSTCITEGYGSIKCNGIVFSKVAFVNDLNFNLVSISQLCDAKCIVQFDEKIGIIFNSNKEVVMIALRVRDIYVLDMTSSA